MSKLIGVEHKSGEIKDQNFKGTGVYYAYYNLHCMSSNALNESDVKGNLTSIVKIKQNQIPDLNPLNWVQKDIDINYDNQNRIKSILVDNVVVYKNDDVL